VGAQREGSRRWSAWHGGRVAKEQSVAGRLQQKCSERRAEKRVEKRVEKRTQSESGSDGKTGCWQRWKSLASSRTLRLWCLGGGDYGRF
jgi:hypothetical protein